MIYFFIAGFSIVILSNLVLLHKLAKAERERVKLLNRMSNLRKDLSSHPDIY